MKWNFTSATRGFWLFADVFDLNDISRLTFTCNTNITFSFKGVTRFWMTCAKKVSTVEVVVPQPFDWDQLWSLNPNMSTFSWTNSILSWPDTKMQWKNTIYFSIQSKHRSSDMPLSSTGILLIRLCMTVIFVRWITTSLQGSTLQISLMPM